MQSPRSGERTVVQRGASDPRFLPTGHLVYVLDEGLFAVPFDANRREIKGTAVRVEEGIGLSPGVVTARPTFSANYDVSEDGALVYIKATPDVRRGTLMWVTRDGRETPFNPVALEQPSHPRFSPDGQRLAVIIAENLWVYDVAGRPPIKILPELFMQDPERLARFEREAKTLAALNHPNIATIHGFEESNGIQALVMELIKGPTLADRIAQGPIPIDEALPIARQIAEALEAAHETGVVHRDLKPTNVMITPDGKVKVLDFGLAKAMESMPAPARLTQSPMTTQPTVAFGNPVSIPRPWVMFGAAYAREYDITRDGRFLGVVPTSQSTSGDIHVVTNWFEELKRRVPTN